MIENKDNHHKTSQESESENKCKKEPFFVDPCEIVAAAAAISLLLGKNLRICQIATLANLFNILSENLSAIVLQDEINRGEIGVVESRDIL